jgi:hypothetical protein
MEPVCSVTSVMQGFSKPNSALLIKILCALLAKLDFIVPI